MDNGRRFWLNLWTGRAAMRRAFPARLEKTIADAVHASETQHRGEIRFVVETACNPLAVWRGLTPRDRALELFSGLRVWDTEQNSGILVYVLFAERHIEIVADRGINARVPQAEWDAVAATMATAYRAGDYAGGSLRAIETLTRLLASHFPAGEVNANELPDGPLLI